MKVFSRNIVNIVANVEKFYTFVFTLFVLLSIRTACGSPTKKVYLTKDNTPSRLTSVAHLGGFLFYKPLEL
jgi:hypothetical protein